MIISDNFILYQDKDILEVKNNAGIIVLDYFCHKAKSHYDFDLSDVKGIKINIVHALNRYAINFISKGNDVVIVVKFESSVKCHSIFQDLKDCYGVRDLDYLDMINSYNFDDD
jgi:hypothetical protein